MVEGSASVEIFCCYSREDETWLRKLETHLSLLKRQGFISLWHDRLIFPGTDWNKAIDTHLETASVILLLVSADFFASDYCYGIEMQRALERDAEGSARVVPILVRPADWTDAPFAHLQALPADARPIVSWQNTDTALADVAAGIRRIIVEELPQFTVSAPSTALPKIWNIPYPRNPFFLGRETELAQIRQHLQAGQTTALSQPQAISGLGGIGKTQLALEYAYRYHHDYTAILWARAESTEALISSYIALATLLNLPEREAKEQEVIIQAVKTWLRTHSGWLLIFDNADELRLLSDFLSPSMGGHLLLTTRASATGRLAHRLEIEILLPEHGALFLLRRAAFLAPDAELSHASPHERQLAMQISQELGGLPLALDQVGAYLEETGIDLASYQHLYQQHRAAFLQERRGLVADHPASVSTTWSLSFERVEEKNPAAADLLRMCAFLSPDAIPEEILITNTSLLGSSPALATVDEFQLNQAIEALRSYSLVRRDPKEKTLSIHRLVQAVLQDTLKNTEKRSWAKRAMLSVNAAFPDVNPDAWPQCERLLPQALIAVQAIERYQMISEEAVRLLHETASYLKDRARYGEAESLYLRAVSIKQQHLGSEHPDVVYPLNGLARLYREQGKYEEAEKLYQRALRISMQHLGSGHPDVASLLTGLARLYREQGKYKEAEPYYQDALRILEQHLGPGYPRVTDPLTGLASLYSHQGKYAEAESLYQRVLQIAETRLGAEHPDVAYPLNGLARLYQEQGRYEEAGSLYQRAFQIRVQHLGPEHPQVVPSLTGLANLYREQGKYEEAESLYQRSLWILNRHLRPSHHDVARSLTGLANLYREQGKHEEAESLYQRALHIRELQLGHWHPSTAETMYDFARLRETQSNRKEARILYARALAVREQTIGAHHPKTMETRTRLIALLHTLGQHEEAAQLEAVQPEL